MGCAVYRSTGTARSSPGLGSPRRRSRCPRSPRPLGSSLTRRGAGERGHRLRRLGEPKPARTGRPVEPVHGAAHDIAARVSLTHSPPPLRRLDASTSWVRTMRRTHPQVHLLVHRAPTARHHLGDVGQSRRHRRKALTVPIPQLRRIWMDGELVDGDKAQVHVLTHTMHYGSGVFEGILMPTERARGRRCIRLRTTSTGCSLRPGLPHRQSPSRPTSSSRRRARCAGGTASTTGATSGPSSTSATAEMGLNPMPSRSRWRSPHGRGAPTSATEGVANGSVQDQLLAAPRPQRRPTAARATGKYVNSSGQGGGVEGGYDRRFLLTPDGKVSECTGENIFVVLDGRLSRAHLRAGRSRDHAEVGPDIARDMGLTAAGEP